MKITWIKKTVCMALAMGCISAQVAFPVSAETSAKVWTEGLYSLFQTVKGKTEGIDTENAQYVWLYSDSEEGEYQEISDTYSENPDELKLIGGGTVETVKSTISPLGEEIEVDAFAAYGMMESSLADKWIKFKVVTDDGEFESKPKYVEKRLTDWIYNITNTGDSKFPVVQATTPSEYIFTIDDQDFILLDVTDDPDNKFFVLTKDTYGKRKYYNNPVFSGQSFNELSYWLDNIFLTEGNEGKKLPDTVVSHIDEVYWKNERSRWGHVQNVYNPVVLGKVAVPTQTEIIKYSDRIGLQDDGESWWTRTPGAGSSGDGNDMIFVYGDSVNLGKTSCAHAQNTQHAIRPIFYLDEDFFADAKIPLNKMGASVRAELFELYSSDELAEMGYTVADIEECSKGSISDVTVSGDAKVGGVLKGEYINDNASEKYITYQWKYSDKENGVYRNISGASALEYKVAMGDAEKWVKLVISYADGKVAESEPVYVASLWDDEFEGTVKEVKLKGVYESFQNIRAEYVLDEITTEEDVVYKNWYISSSERGTYGVIADAGEVLKTDTSYCGKWIKYGVQLKNRMIYYSEPKQIGNAWNFRGKELTIAGGSNPLETINAKTPEEYLFTVGDQEFILLDSFDSDTSAFLVLAKSVYGTRQFYKRDEGQRFNDMITWLNNDFYAAGNDGKKLPSEITSYIDMEQGWKQEHRRWDTTTELGYYGGISIPAITELHKYSEKIGLQDDEADWWLRTPTTEAYQDGNYMQYVSGDAEKLGATLGKHGTNSSSGIRPMFYINKDFFIDNKLDPETTGSEVYKTLAKKYTKNELRHLYDNRTLEDVFGYPGDYTVKIYDLGDMSGTDEVFLLGVTTHIDPKDAIVVVNIFDKDNRLVGVNTQATRLETEVESEILLEYANLPEGEGKYMTAHILENKNGKLIPLFYAKNEFTEM